MAHAIALRSGRINGMEVDFGENSLAVRWFTVAKRYMMAVDALLRTEDYAVSRALHVPTLHLVGHGIEVLMKANLLVTGMTAAEVKNMGHNLSALWSHHGNEMLRAHALIEARQAWESARTSGKYLDAFSENPDDLLVKYLHDLSVLHSAQSDYALRYVSDKAEMIPRPFLLAATFLALSDFALKQPSAMRPDFF